MDRFGARQTLITPANGKLAETSKTHAAKTTKATAPETVFPAITARTLKLMCSQKTIACHAQQEKSRHQVPRAVLNAYSQLTRGAALEITCAQATGVLHRMIWTGRGRAAAALPRTKKDALPAGPTEPADTVKKTTTVTATSAKNAQEIARTATNSPQKTLTAKAPRKIFHLDQRASLTKTVLARSAKQRPAASPRRERNPSVKDATVTATVSQINA
jgi:hypothetical protein